MPGKKKKQELLPADPFARSVFLIGNKWKLLILRCLLSRAMPWHLTELKNAIDGIDQTVLKVTLQSMEADGLITSTVYRDLPPRIEFFPSEAGRSAQPVLEAMEAWGESYRQ